MKTLFCYQLNILFLLGSILFCLKASSQNNPILSDASLAEKIYLQLDSENYSNNGTIWFKALVLNGVTHTPTSKSGVLRVELINPMEEIVQQKILKIKDGVAENFFDLHKSYPEGKYLVRAYTNWNRNFGEDFLFTSYINVFSYIKEPEVSAIGSVMLEDHPQFSVLKAQLNPTVIDSLQKKKLKVILNLDGNKDSLVINKKQNQYLLEYELKEQVDLAIITLETENDYRASKSILLNEEKVDLGFYPESGNFIAGIQNKIGFKAVDYSGKGVAVKGTLYNDQGEVIKLFTSNDKGMGFFYLQPEEQQQYYARLSFGNKTSAKQFQLPPVQKSGSVLSLSPDGDDHIRMLVKSAQKSTDSLRVSCSFRGVGIYKFKAVINDGRFLTALPHKIFPDGILSFTLEDKNGNPIAERLYFNQRKDARLVVAISSDKNFYMQREKTRLKIGIKDSLNNLKAAKLSLLAVDKALLGDLQKRRSNIISYFLLTSEIKGTIEKPRSYFNENNKDRLNDLEALLLTQGWRKYHYHRPVSNKFDYKIESVLILQGDVKDPLFNRIKDDVELTLMSFGKGNSIQEQRTDSLGKFQFNIDHLEGGDTNIIIQSKKNGNKRNYNINIGKYELPKIKYNISRTLTGLDSIARNIKEEKQEQHARITSFEFANGINQLEEVHLEGYAMTPERQKTTERFGKPEVVIRGKDIQEKEEKWSYGLYSVLMFNFPEDIRITRVNEPGGYLQARVTGREKTLIVIDGIPVMGHDYNLIPNIPPSEVKSVEIIRFANGFSKLYRDVFPQEKPSDAPATGHVIAIYTHGEKGIFNVQKPKGLLQTSIKTYAAQKEFYAPEYENNDAEKVPGPDLRSVIYWEPNLETEEGKDLEISYFNPDNAEEVMVIIESITSSGQIGYHEFTYKVQPVRGD